MKHRLITPSRGEKLAVHVFVPALRYRRENPSVLLPTVCVRSSIDGFSRARFFERVDFLGESSLKMFGEAMPGTGGMAQVLLVTRAPIVARWIFDVRPVRTRRHVGGVGGDIDASAVTKTLLNAWLFFRAERDGGEVALISPAGGESD